MTLAPGGAAAIATRSAILLTDGPVLVLGGLQAPRRRTSSIRRPTYGSQGRSWSPRGVTAPPLDTPPDGDY